MSPMGFEPTVSAGERPQTYPLDRGATGTSIIIIIIIIIIYNLRSLIKQNNYTVLMGCGHKRLQSVLNYIDNDKIRHHPQHRYALQSKHPNHSSASVMFAVASK